MQPTLQTEYGLPLMCKPAFQKRIVYGLFILPFNRINDEELHAALPDQHYVRYSEGIFPADILFTTLGFMLGFITKTRVIEDCGPALAMPEGMDIRGEVRRLSTLRVPVSLRFIGPELRADRVEHKVILNSLYIDTNTGLASAAYVGEIVMINEGRVLLRQNRGVRTIPASSIAAIEILLMSGSAHLDSYPAQEGI